MIILQGAIHIFTEQPNSVAKSIYNGLRRQMTHLLEYETIKTSTIIQYPHAVSYFCELNLSYDYIAMTYSKKKGVPVLVSIVGKKVNQGLEVEEALRLYWGNRGKCISKIEAFSTGKSFDLLTTRQAKEIFKWYTDDIPARLDQLQKCIDADVNGTVQLTRGKDSLRPLWSWLVANIQLQELTESDLKESLDAVPKWLHEYIVAGKYKLTTESLSIGMDVAIYLGEVFVHEFPQIYWGFFTKPKSRVSVNEPVLLGFENGLDMNPRRIVDTLMWQCANGKSSEGLYEVFEIWSKFVPAQPSKTN